MNLGGVSILEDPYHEAVRRLVRSEDEVCGTWLREGTEPATGMANKTTADANSKDLVRAIALFRQECFAWQVWLLAKSVAVHSKYGPNLARARFKRCPSPRSP